MAKLERYIAPDEPVLWRTPDLRSFAVDFGKLLAWTLAIPFVVVVLSLDTDFAAGAMLIPALVLGYAAKTILRGPSEALLTGRQLLFRRRIRRPEVKAIARRDIYRLEIFAGDDALVVHGRHGELHRATLLGDDMELARELNLPTTLWTPYEPPKRTRRIEFVLMVLLPFAVMGFMIAFVVMLPDAFFGAIRDNISDPAKGFVASVVVLSGGALSVPPAVVFVSLVRRLVLPREELNRLRCSKFNKLWRGEDPGAARSGGMLRGIRRAFDRLIYGPFPECSAIEPERYEPGAFPPSEEDEES